MFGRLKQAVAALEKEVGALDPETKTYRGFVLKLDKGKWRLDPPSDKRARASP